MGEPGERLGEDCDAGRLAAQRRPAGFEEACAEGGIIPPPAGFAGTLPTSGEG